MIKPDRIVTTTCPYCGVGCTLQLHVRNDFIYKVTSPFDSPVNHGNLCVKGRFGYDFIYHPKRVTTPLVRRYLLEGKPKPEGREQVFAVSADGKPISNSQTLAPGASAGVSAGQVGEVALQAPWANDSLVIMTA